MVFGLERVSIDRTAIVIVAYTVILSHIELFSPLFILIHHYDMLIQNSLLEHSPLIK